MKSSDTSFEGLDVPPRYVSNARLHLGHAVTYSYCEVFKNLFGIPIYPLCFDGNGLPIEKAVQEKTGVSPFQEEFYELCHDMVSENCLEMAEQFLYLGLNFNRGQAYRTDEESYRFFTQRTFLELLQRGAIERKEDEGIFCPNCNTALSQGEVEKVRKITKGLRLTGQKGEKLILSLKDSNDYYWTTENPRIILFSYAGKNFRIFPIRKNENVQTGIAIPSDNIYSKTFTILETREEETWEKVEEFPHEFHQESCWRCKGEVILKRSTQWFLRILDLKDGLKEMSKRITWYPADKEKILLNWIDSLAWDWCISRDRVYGTQIPVWECSRCGQMKVPPKIEKYFPRGSKYPGEDCCHNSELKMTSQVFDTWMDSSLTSFYLAEKHRANSEEFMRVQSYDIIRTWAFYSLVQGVLKRKLPWKWIVITPFVLTDTGEEMHTSAGNRVDIEKILSVYSPFDIKYLVCNMNPGNTVKFSVAILEQARRLRNKMKNIKAFLEKYGAEVKIPEVKATDQEFDIDGLKFKSIIVSITQEIMDFSNKIIPRLQKNEYTFSEAFEKYNNMIYSLSKFIPEALDFVARLI